MTQHLSCYSVAKSHLTLWDPMDCSMPGFSVLHYLLGLAQTHVILTWRHPTISSSVTLYFALCKALSIHFLLRAGDFHLILQRGDKDSERVAHFSRQWLNPGFSWLGPLCGRPTSLSLSLSLSSPRLLSSLVFPHLIFWLLRSLAFCLGPTP